MSENEISDFLDELFNSTKYVFNIPVMIETSTKTYETGIISRRYAGIPGKTNWDANHGANGRKKTKKCLWRYWIPIKNV